jgi:hypothetical protein
MVSKQPKISKETAAVLTTNITLRIPETLNIIRKPGMLQSRLSLWEHKVWTVDQLRYKETQGKNYT